MNSVHQVYVSIGSNIDKKFYIQQAINALNHHFSQLELSPIYETEAVGFEGDSFYNLAAGFSTGADLQQVMQLLKTIEDQNQRDRDQQKFSSRTLDIDLLLFDDINLTEQGINIPRDEILKYAFVLKPLSDIRADLIHPATGISMAEHWQQMQQQKPMTMKTVVLTA